MKTCKSCKWSTDNRCPEDGKMYQCQSPQNPSEVDIITGETRHPYTMCEVHRSGEQSHLCGPSGKWWEAKEEINEEVE